MRKKIYGILFLIMIMLTSTMIGGCSNPIKAENANLSEVIDRIDKENKELKEEVRQLQEKTQELDDEIEKIVEEKEDPDEEIEETTSAFNIYGADIDSYEEEIIGEISIDDSMPIEEKLNALGQELSKMQFEGLGIEVDKIEEEDGKKVATINLKEAPNDKDYSWIATYFQGSAGGTITTVSLGETFLQREYEGEWIDGVKFVYEGEEIVYDHVESLGQISYR
ncbi:MAG: hypothetical protein GX366_03480 [Epulopiscium sp.]|nr:hypothetical protein [Candidatus Epulonipiscium sp.]